MYWLGGAGGGSGDTIGTLGSGGGTSGVEGKIEEKSRGSFGGRLGGRRNENSKGALVYVGKIGLRVIL